MAAKCSLVISTYNWPKALKLCLDSVLRQSVLPAEVIIADDGSGEETKKLIQLYQSASPVRIIHVWHADKGFRKSVILNKAIQQTSSDYIIQVDGDVILNKHFIADHLHTREAGAFIRGTRAMLSQQKTAGLMANGDSAAGLSALSAGVQHRFNGMRLALLSGLVVRKKMSSNSVRGSNLAYWKADFVKINGYNNALQGWGHEDEELAARLINLGIVKKIVKLRAVQFHLYHDEGHRQTADNHRAEIERIKEHKIIACENGYLQAADYE